MYYQQDKSVWEGRVDSSTDPTKFRFHQVIEVLSVDDLKTITINDDLLNIGFIGFKSDLGVKRNLGDLGSSEAPYEIRKELRNIPYHFEKAKLYDFGDIIVKTDLAKGQSLLSEVVTKLLTAGIIPIVIGGGHETALGSTRGLLKYANQATVHTINFDAHFDLRDIQQTPNSGTMFTKLIRDYGNYYYHVVGIQKVANTQYLFEKATEHPSVSFDRINKVRNVNYNIIDRFVGLEEDFYNISICADVIQCSEMPGVSAPNINGISYSLLSKFLKDLILNLSTIKVFDLSEVNPKKDAGGISVNVAKNLIFDIIDYLYMTLDE